ncbi:STAS domain-containing protein [Wenjunlia tyrosinilytica]|uniref:Anti-sigma factor antagonist n=1 Tax=Wenjunlia tyrosinilytica TaxID=1544741 RepID=A0A918E188_9ACTN|nr:STAS domain-containing protein [Wenjunlia tyrosinilytica]GGO97045.1 anti-sigma factor antagonist [Wenjunlia tyrosinilytica]
MTRPLPELTLRTRRGPRSCVVSVEGELDHDTAPQLRRALEELPTAEGGLLVLDLAGLEFCDSSGITALLAAHRRCTAAGAVLALACANSAVARVVHLTGLDQVFPLYTTVAEAQASLGSIPA